MTWRSRTTLYADRASWLAGRERGVGASSVAAILGASPFAGPWDVWAGIRRGVEVEEPEEEDREGGVDLNDPRVRGTVLEPMVLQCHGLVTGQPTLAIGEALGHPGHVAITRHASLPWLHASLDGITVAPDLGEGCVEAKTSKASWKWGASGTVIESWHDEADRLVPEHILIQGWTQLLVTGLPYCDVAVFTGGFAFRWYRLLRHEAELAGLGRVVGEWYDRHIVRGEEPDRDGSLACIADARARLEANRIKVRRATAEEAAWIEVLGARKAAERAADLARAHLLAAMVDCARLTMPPGPDGAPRGVRCAANGALTAFGFDP